MTTTRKPPARKTSSAKTPTPKTVPVVRVVKVDNSSPRDRQANLYYWAVIVLGTLFLMLCGVDVVVPVLTITAVTFLDRHCRKASRRTRT
jgi:hypothetical protein